MQYVLILLLTALVLSSPFDVLARHNDRIDTDALDDDSPEVVPIPVLFGVSLDDVAPDFDDVRGGGTRTHEGQDMRAPQGAPIVSPTEAIVVRTGSGVSSGKYVYTANPGGEQFRYMHLDSTADIERGDRLDVGDFIGTVGDTGNAPDGVYHLHLEIRADGEATDPYPRLADTFSLREKVSFLDDIFHDMRDEDAYAAFLVEHFRDDLTMGLERGYDLPGEVEEALADAGIFGTQRALVRLHSVLATIPPLLQHELYEGSQGAAVTLLQFYLIYESDGVARDALAAVGATGYFGPLTSAAIAEYQAAQGISVTGSYDPKTRATMMTTGRELSTSD